MISFGVAESAYDQLRRLYNKRLDETETEAIDTKKIESKKYVFCLDTKL